MLDSARRSHRGAFSTAMGLPISVSRTDGDQDDLGRTVLRFGTYKVFRNRLNDKLQTSLQTRATLSSSVSDRLKNPNFIRAFASGVLLVKPVGRSHHLDLTYVGFGWYKLNSLPSLSGVRKLIGWALSSPSTVFSIWGHSLREVSRMYSDQILWLQSNWSLPFEERKTRAGLQDHPVESLDSRKKSLSDQFLKYDLTLHVGHCRSDVPQTFRVWTLRCRSRMATASTHSGRANRPLKLV